TAAAVIEAATHFGIPLSTTHVISGSIMGVGASKRLTAVKWGVAGRMIWAWVLTLPVTGGLAHCLLRRLPSFGISLAGSGPTWVLETNNVSFITTKIPAPEKLNRARVISLQSLSPRTAEPVPHRTSGFQRKMRRPRAGLGSCEPRLDRKSSNPSE